MRNLFDQGAPVPIAAYLREHTVRTTLQEGWDTLANGDLLRVAEEAGFEILLTTDNNLALCRVPDYAEEKRCIRFRANNDGPLGFDLSA
jgi:hypothetical protein